MKNIVVDGHEAEDIASQVRKVIRGLGNPDPPLKLDEALELLRLDRAYYSVENQGPIREYVSRVMVAGKQIVRRPTLLLEAIRKAKLSALWLPDKKRILIDESTPKLKHRWNEAHEIGHSIIPWHQELLLGDNEFSLNPACHARMEAEAHYAAGRLLFLAERFGLEAIGMPFGFASVQTLSKRFGNTLTSTLWRYVEGSHFEFPVVGIVSRHPRVLGDECAPENPCRHMIRSPHFRKRFSGVSEKDGVRLLRAYCNMRPAGPLGEKDVVLADDDGFPHLFHFESFAIKYYVLTLGRHLRPIRPAVRVA